MEEKEKELTPKQVVKRSLNYSIKQYKIAVRWLGDARAYKNRYGGDVTMNGETWKSGIEGDLATDAAKAYKEAARNVLFWRKKIDWCNNKLMELCSKKGPPDES